MIPSSLHIPILQLPHATGLSLPAYATAGSVGCDLQAAIDDPVTLTPGARIFIPTGFALALPQGYEAQIRSRSGLALKHGVIVLNAPGTIDSDYRGEVGALMINLGTDLFVITRGMRIAQMVIAPVSQVLWESAVTLPPAPSRGEGGFGSTGL